MARGLSVQPAQTKLTFWSVLRVALRVLVPVLLLLAVYVAAYLGLATPITAFDVFPNEKWFLNPGYWMTAGHLLLPLAFFAMNLTNRRYGDGYAFASLVITWAIIGIALYWMLQIMGGYFPASPLPSRRVSLAFLFAIIVGQSVAIFVFDRTRGRIWWGAPLFSMLWGQTVFVVLFWALSYIGMSDPWTNFMLMDLAVKVASAFVLLIPYAALRPLIRPAPGYGGA